MEFAYKEDEFDEKPCSEIHGVYRCTKPMAYEPIPPEALDKRDNCTHAWAIKGKHTANSPSRQ